MATIRKAFRNEYGRAPNDAEVLLVRSAERILKRIRELRAVVESEGMMIPSTGGDRLHPCLQHESQLESKLLQVLKALGLTPVFTKSGVRKAKPQEAADDAGDSLAEFATKLQAVR